MQPRALRRIPYAHELRVVHELLGKYSRSWRHRGEGDGSHGHSGTCKALGMQLRRAPEETQRNNQTKRLTWVGSVR